MSRTVGSRNYHRHMKEFHGHHVAELNSAKFDIHEKGDVIEILVMERNGLTGRFCVDEWSGFLRIQFERKPQ